MPSDFPVIRLTVERLSLSVQKALDDCLSVEEIKEAVRRVVADTDLDAMVREAIEREMRKRLEYVIGSMVREALSDEAFREAIARKFVPPASGV